MDVANLVTRLSLAGKSEHDSGIQASARLVQDSARAFSSFGAAGDAAMKQLQTSAAQLSARIEQNKATMLGFDQAIAKNRAEMAALAQQITQLNATEGANKEQVAALQGQYKNLASETRVLSAEKGKLAVENKQLQGQLKATEAEMKQLSATSKGLTFKEFYQGLQNVGSQLKTTGILLTATITAPLAVLAKNAIQAGVEFESAFAGVRKTVDATEPQLARLREGIRQLATDMPATAVEIAKVAEAAGQLGIKTENILSFTKVMIDLGNTTNLSAEEAATALARLANITQLPQDQFDRLGSTIVDLGNKFATTEAEIVEMGLRLAGAGEQVKLTEAQILGFATALTSVGINAEAGGTAFSRVMLQIQDAAKSGGKQLEAFAQVAGVSAAEFKKRFETDAAGAIVLFVEGLKRMSDQGENLLPVLGGLELGEIRVRDALLRTANAGDLLRNAIDTGTQAWASNTALTKEAEQRYQTFESQVKIMQNRLTELGIILFEKIRPALISVVSGVSSAIEILTKLDPAIAASGAAFLAVFGVAGPVVLAIGGVISLLGGPLTLAVIGFTTQVAIMAAAVALNFDALAKAIEAFTGDSSFNMHEAAKAVGSVADVFSIFGRVVVIVLDVSLSTIKAFVQGAIGAFKVFQQTVGEVIDALATGNVVALGRAFLSLPGKIDESTKAMMGTIRGFGARLGDNLNAIGEHIEGKLSREFGKAEFKAQDSFKNMKTAISNASKEIKDSLEKAGKAAEEFGKKTGDGAKKGAGKTKDALKELLGYINEYLGSLKEKIKLNEDIWGGLVPGTKRALTEQTLVNKIAQEEITRVMAEEQGKRKNIQEIDIFLWEKFGKTVDGVSNGVKEKIRSVGGIVIPTFKSITEAIEKVQKSFEDAGKEMKDDADLIGGYAKQIGDSFEDAAKRIKDAAPAPRTFAEQIKDAIEGTAIVSMVRMRDEVRSAVGSVIRDFEEMGAQAGLTGDALIAFVRDKVAVMVAQTKGLSDEQKQAIEEMVNKWEKELSRLPGIWEKVFGKLPDSVKRSVGDALEIIDLLPGKVGDSLRKVTNEFERWTAIIDKILGVLNRTISEKIPGSIESAIESIIGIFRKKTGEVEGAAQGMFAGIPGIAGNTGAAAALGLAGAFSSFFKGSEANTASDGYLEFLNGLAGVSGKSGEASGQSFSDGFLGALPAIAGGLATFFGTRGQGRLTGILGGAAAGAQIGAKIGSIIPGLGTGIGAGIGAAAGAIFGGLFGSGKSQAQKEAEEQAKKEAAQRLAQGATDILKGGLDAFNAAADLLFKAQDYTGTPRKALKKLVADTRFLINEFIAALKDIATETAQKAGQVGEAFAPAVQLLSAVIDIGNQMKDRHRPTEADFAGVVEDFDFIEKQLEKAYESIEIKVAKQIFKIANKLGPAFELLKTQLDISKQLADTPEPDLNAIEKQFDGLFKVVELYESKMDLFKAFALSKIKRTAEQVTAIAQSIIESLGLGKAINEAPGIDLTALDARTDELLAVLDWQDNMNDIARRGLDKALTFEDLMTDWGNAIATGLSRLAAIGGGSFNIPAPGLPGGGDFDIPNPGGGGGIVLPPPPSNPVASSSVTQNNRTVILQFDKDDPRTDQIWEFLTGLIPALENN